LAATLLCAVAVAASGCGSSGEVLTHSEADKALAALDSVQALVDQGRCKAAQRRVQLLIDQASKVNKDRQDLGAAYAKSAERLQQLVTRECVEVKVSSPTEPVTSATGDTGPTDTPQPTSTPEPPQPVPTGGGTAPDQPNNNGGNGNGNGNGGNGNGNGNAQPGNSGGVRPQ
jgi:hypothetical protein